MGNMLHTTYLTLYIYNPIIQTYSDELSMISYLRNSVLQLRSTSLSLDGLVDYTAKDIEESVFEVCVL